MHTAQFSACYTEATERSPIDRQCTQQSRIPNLQSFTKGHTRIVYLGPDLSYAVYYIQYKLKAITHIL
jgi:hypothetical protein